MAAPISAGALDQRITLASASYTKSALGGPVKAAGAGTTLWAQVDHVGAGERFAEGALQTRPELRVTIRYRTGVKLRDVLTWRGVVYEIIAEPKEASNRQQRRFLELLVVKQKLGGASN